MRDKKLKITVEDTENGEVTEISSNCIAVVTADDTEEGNDRDVKIFTIGRCRKVEMLACAEGLGKAERKMRERALEDVYEALGDRLKDFVAEVKVDA